jgi:TonB family protein
MRISGDIRTRILRDRDEKKARTIGLVTGLTIHIIVFGVLYFLPPETAELNPLAANDFGGFGGGGGGGDTKEYVIEFGATGQAQSEEAIGTDDASRFTIINLSIIHPVEEGTPVVKKEEKKPKPRKRQQSVVAIPAPKRYIRGAGPGSGGGTGGGSGGGIGKGQGYSIDWGGLGSRRILSERLPRYPSGTDKEMPVQLEFTVLGDGTVSNVLPTRKSDELLEREAISALLTWKFDPLPLQYEQKPQVGRITFNFKLER